MITAKRIRRTKSELAKIEERIRILDAVETNMMDTLMEVFNSKSSRGMNIKIKCIERLSEISTERTKLVTRKHKLKGKLNKFYGKK